MADIDVGEAVLRVLVENRKVVLSVFKKHVGMPDWPEAWERYFEEYGPNWSGRWLGAAAEEDAGAEGEEAAAQLEYHDKTEEKEGYAVRDAVADMQTLEAEAKLLSILASVSASMKAFVDQRVPPTARADAAKKLAAVHDHAWLLYEDTDGQYAC